jgi:hypothetical protein
LDWLPQNANGILESLQRGPLRISEPGTRGSYCISVWRPVVRKSIY